MNQEQDIELKNNENVKVRSKKQKPSVLKTKIDEKKYAKIKQLQNSWAAPDFEEPNKLLEVRNLHVSFPIGRNKIIHIVRGVDIDVYRGQIIGLVGESGSGKSVTSKTLINVNEHGIISADKMQINNWELTKIKKEKYLEFEKIFKGGF